MFCKNCGNTIATDDKFCFKCGTPNRTANQNNNTANQYAQSTTGNSSGNSNGYSNQSSAQGQNYQSTSQNAASQGSGQNVFSDFAGKLGNLAGVEAPSHIKPGEILLQVFKKHTETEAEKLFTTGTEETTPDVNTLESTWPKPWLFARVLVIMAICYFVLYIGFTTFSNINCLPGLIMMGSFLMPMTLLVFFWEMNVPRNISFYKVIKMFFLGGVLSLLIALLLFSFTSQTPAVIDAIITGFIEETAKVAAILIFIKDKRSKYLLNGLLIGAAVGAGFAAFESASYALRIGLQAGANQMFETIFWRAILAPGGHIVWAGLAGAALYMVKGSRDFEATMLKDFRFLRVFLIVMGMHALWDMPIPEMGGIPVHMFALIIVSWIIAIAMINTGLKEVSGLKNQGNISQ